MEEYKYIHLSLREIEERLKDLLEERQAEKFDGQIHGLQEIVVRVDNNSSLFGFEDKKSQKQIEKDIRSKKNELSHLMSQTNPGYARYWIKKALLELGKDYLNRVAGNRTRNLKNAIKYLEQALDFTDPKRTKFEWADIQKYLGKAYLKRTDGSPSENIRKSLYHFEQARIATKTLASSLHGNATIDAPLPKVPRKRKIRIKAVTTVKKMQKKKIRSK